MKKLLLYCFDTWWRPILFFFIIALLVILNSELNIRFLKKPLHFLANFSAIVLLISFCYQIYKARFLKAFVNIFILFITGIISMLVTMLDGDHWADDLTIPPGIQIENPVNLQYNSRPDSILQLTKNQIDLVLYNSMQSGIYEYDFWTDTIEEGVIFLKAYEITQNEELSEDNLEKSSKQFIHNSTNYFQRFSSTRNFTIYEGDWGKFYAARFEVWFKPRAGREERKLFQKNFKIEGWMH